MMYALVTGASKGIGRAIATELASRKVDLLLVARDAVLLQEVAKELHQLYGVKIEYLQLDLSLADAASQVVAWCNANQFQVNIVINNAGYGLSGLFEKYTYPQHLNMMQLNMQTPVALITAFLPKLKLLPQSYIMNIGSGAVYQAVPGLSLYAATKSFLYSFSRGLRYELRNTTVSVTIVNPGATDTDFAVRADVNTEKAKKAAEKFNMTPASVAKIAVDGMFAKKAEVIPGFINKIAAFAAWLLPKQLLEKGAADIYGV